jgi:hypothetical protein
MQRVEPAQVISELFLCELGLSRLGFAPTEITRPDAGVSVDGPRYGWVEDFSAILYDEEADMAGLINLEIEKGANFSHTFYWKSRSGAPVDITGASVLMQVRATQDTGAAHKASIASYAAPPAAPLPWFNSIDITALEGKILVTLSSSDTSQIEEGEWWYDMKVTLQSGEVHRLVQGRMKVDPAVTA